MDYSKIPNEAEMDLMLDECEDHIAALRKHFREVWTRAKVSSRGGYPRRSPGTGTMGGSGHGDPTGAQVITLAGGKLDEETGDTTPDTWPGARDEVSMEARQMNREAFDARNRLRGATAAMARALPVTIPDVPREVCVTCGVSKKVAKRWVIAEGRCESCSSRIKRVGKAAS